MKLFLSYQNGSHRGPGILVQNLKGGLSKTNIQIVADLNKADIVGCLQHPGNDYNKFPKATVFGPNIFVLPDEEPILWNNFNNWIVPSEWVKNLYNCYNTDNKRIINTWAVGIDIEYWKPINNFKKTLDCFIYYKNRPKEELLEIVKFLKLQKFNFKIIKYGDYQEYQLKELCNISKFVVLLDDSESQGLGVMQILAMDVPMFVINKTIWTNKEKSFSATSVPYFSDSCGIICNDKDKKNYLYLTFEFFMRILNNEEPKLKFKPRKFIEENFNLELKAREYVDILVKSFS